MAEAKNWALFLDIDGTLLDLAAKPDLVVVPAELPGVLAALTAHLGGALALISGRTLSDIDWLFPGGGDAAGSHGAEWRRAGMVKASAAVGPELHALAAGAETLPGILVERKPLAVALHYRDAPQLAAQVRGLAHNAVAAAPVALRVLEGKSVIEVVPANADKGAAISRFMTCPPFAGRCPVFIGDDVTDESGFSAVNRLGGRSIHVGGNIDSVASRKIASPTAVRRWLAGVERKLRGHAHGQS
ncbi:trehalose-phosphatase [Magnetospirillum sulfuroxidans]|uniref:Trehalose 6-phosphate phosphatase n=1 Tax=Magnetospirillum sulfuroxidans TaxID=611300 RepID=A0ABS5IGX1_9PROT|nr:trehalose-phosphatase [Magnetospirillum sulfuroxidans]MBR9973671.1 trehalose-phosphatase [Magnetospirillum sulfuroxidans]